MHAAISLSSVHQTDQATTCLNAEGRFSAKSTCTVYRLTAACSKLYVSTLQVTSGAGLAFPIGAARNPCQFGILSLCALTSVRLLSVIGTKLSHYEIMFHLGSGG